MFAPLGPKLKIPSLLLTCRLEGKATFVRAPIERGENPTFPFTVAALEKERKKAVTSIYFYFKSPGISESVELQSTLYNNLPYKIMFRWL